MTEVFDLDAVGREADGVPFRFKFGGEEYELPPSIDVRASALLAHGELFEGLELMLGVDQWKSIMAAEEVLDSAKLDALLKAYAKHSGLSLGESSASTGSSRSTGGPSKRTSRRTIT